MNFDNKILRAFFTILICCGLSPWIQAQGSRQKLTISNLDQKKGKLYIGWYSSKEDFRESDKAVLKNIVEVSNRDSVTVWFNNVIPGTYAIAVFFDVNDNGKMDTNLFGIPKEKYGFSNNVYPMMRAATFAESSISIRNPEQVIHIRLH